MCMCRFLFRIGSVLYGTAPSFSYPMWKIGIDYFSVVKLTINFKSVQQWKDPFLNMSRTERNSTTIFVQDY